MQNQTSPRDEPTLDAQPQSCLVPSVTVLSGENEGLCIEVKGQSFTIGRSGSNSLSLNDKAVSRRHAAIELKDGRYIIYDLNSRWGIKVNGIEAKEKELKYGDEIEVAGTRLGFSLVSKDELSKRKPRWRRLAIVILAFAAIAGAVTLFYFRYQTKADLNRPGADVLSKIIYHYDQGIYYYNQMTADKDKMEDVVKEMKKVIELDPEGKTQFSRSARRIIDGLEK